MGSDDAEGPDRALYALLHLDPDASDDDIKKAYRNLAQVYHPDKHATLHPEMQETAKQNFQRICEAYEILSDERKRQIYDIYGMEGLRAGMELGPKLKTREEIREEYEKLKTRREEQKLSSHLHQTGSMLINISLEKALRSSFRRSPNLTGMAMATQVQAQLSKKDTIVAGGSMVLRRGRGGGNLTVLMRRQFDQSCSAEVTATLGLRSVLSCQVMRQLSPHSTGSLGLSLNLADGSLLLTETWTRQLGEATTGNIQLLMGPELGVGAGWQHHGKKHDISSDVKVGPSSLGFSAQVTRQFSQKSKGRVSGKLAGNGIEVEIGGERSISDHSSAAMYCVLGTQGILWKLRFNRGNQKFVIPILLAGGRFDPLLALGALFLPSAIYALLKVYVIKPYFLKRARRKNSEQRHLTLAQVLEARESARKSQELLKLVAERKLKKAQEAGGLVITSATYGNLKALKKPANRGQDDTDPPPYLDVTVPLQFLVDDSNQLKLHFGIKKSGLMGFCDPCIGEPKELAISYTYKGRQYEMVAGDYDEVFIPHPAHMIQDGE